MSSSTRTGTDASPSAPADVKADGATPDPAPLTAAAAVDDRLGADGPGADGPGANRGWPWTARRARSQGPAAGIAGIDLALPDWRVVPAGVLLVAGFVLLMALPWSPQVVLHDGLAFALLGLSAAAITAAVFWLRRCGRRGFQSTSFRAIGTIVSEGVSTYRRMRWLLYCALHALAANFALQTWHAHQTESVRSAENTVIETTALQRMLNQRIARVAVSPTLAQSGEQTNELRAAVDHSDLQAQRLAELLQAQPFGPMEAHPELAQALEQWELQRQTMMRRARALEAAAVRGDVGASAALALGLAASADQALPRIQAVLDHMYATASQGHALRVRQTQVWALVNIVLLTMLAAFAIEPALRGVRRHYRRLAAQALELQRLALVAERTSNAVLLVDEHQRVAWANQAFGRITGISCASVIGREVQTVLRSVEDDAQSASRLQRSLDSGVGARLQIKQRASDGRPLWLNVDVQPLRSDDGTAQGYVAVSADITELKLTQADLKVAAIAFDSLGGISITDPQRRILRVNAAFSEITGYSAEEARGRTPAELMRCDRHDEAFYDRIWQTLDVDRHWQGEVWNRRKSGEVYPKWLSITAVCDDDGRVMNYVSVFTDITEKKRSDETIRSLAFYDPLTKLPNRRLLRERIEAAIAASARSGRRAALLFIDLDHFKELNDSKGHDVGDQLLVEVARRLSAGLRSDDTVARQGGDEFVVLVANLDSDAQQATAQAQRIAESIRRELNRPYVLGEYRHHSSPSIGVSMFLGAEHGVEELLKRADSAMYLAKRSGRNAFRFFDAAMHAALEQRVELELDLRRAHEQRQLTLYFQPQVDLHGRILGAEVLLRWFHPERGEVSPAIFVPLAEESDLILDIGQWVLESALQQLLQWQARPVLADLTLAVNVSARQFQRSDFAATVRQVLAPSALPPGRLKLELTESLILGDVDEVVRTMDDLRRLGVQLSLDDFGTGQSSLSYLTRLPLDQIKIDQSFVRKLSHSRSDAAVVQTIVGLSQHLGIEVIAEGVETETQRRMLESMGCANHQGFLFGRPMPLAQFEALLEAGAPLGPAPRG